MSGSLRLTTIRETRVLTPIGWVILSMAFGLALVSFILFIHPFLAPIKPVEGRILVVQGLFSDYEIEKVKERFEKGNYELLVVVGNELETDHPLAQYKNMANWAISKYKVLGVPEGEIIPISFKPPKINRTYYQALIVQKKFNEIGLTEIPIDVVSSSVHARRTWILFEKVFSSVNVGIIAIYPNTYDASRWWLSSMGVRNVISESIAYIYARFIFSPPIK